MKLNVYNNNNLVSEFDSDKEALSSHQEIFIGRASDCHVMINDHKISRHHAIIKKDNRRWKILKISSTSPVLLNGVSIEENELNDSDIIQIGDCVINVVAPRTDGVPAKQDMSATMKLPSQADLAEPSIKVSSIQESVEKKEEAQAEDSLSDLSSENPPSQEGAFSNDEQSSEQNTETSAENGQDFSDGNQAIDSNDGMMEGGDNLPATEVGESTVVFKGFSTFELQIFGEFAPYDRFTLEASETFIGRNKEKCQIVLDDPESSGVHAVIKKIGGQCILQDLGSSNGTLYKGERINNVELLNNDEFVIGSTSFTLSIRSKNLNEGMGNLMPVQDNQVITKEEIVEEEVEFDPNAVTGTESGAGQENKSILKDPAKRKKLLYGLVALAAIWVFLSEEEPAKKPVENPNKNKIASKDGKKDAPKKAAKEKRNYTKEQLEFLESAYQLAKALFNQGKYNESLIELDKVLQIDPDYKEASQLRDLAKQGLARLDELAKKQKAEEERKERMAKVVLLLEKARVAVKDRQAVLAESLFGQIMELDPENIDVPQLKLELDAWKKEQERIALEKAQKEAERKRMIDLLAPGKTYYLKKDWYKAIVKLEEFLKQKGMDEDLIKEASDMLTESKNNLNAMIAPILGKARSLKEGQDLKGAYENYAEVLRIDPTHTEALNEMSEIRQLLDTRSKKVYREAIISESLSLFEDAREKFQEVQQISPSDSDYYRKATEKLKNYLE